MAIIKAKPTSPGRRFVSWVVTPELYKGRPLRSLSSAKKRISGRNNQGRITLRHRGGGHKRQYRILDFKRDKDDIIARVERIEYDPNRSAHLALLLYQDGERRYIIAPTGVAQGTQIVSGQRAPIKVGNCLPLANIPLGSMIHCVELYPGAGAQLVRSAGGSAQLVAVEGEHAIIKLSSGEVRKVSIKCRASIGSISNAEHNLRSLGKAGASRWRGRRPSVRGVAMNPVDHPHGGGEGKTSGGRHPVSITGVPAKGFKTRNNKRTDPMIIRRRRKKGRKR